MTTILQNRNSANPNHRYSTTIRSPVGLRKDQITSFPLDSSPISPNMEEPSASRRPQQNLEHESSPVNGGDNYQLPRKAYRFSRAIEAGEADALEDLSGRTVHLFKLFRLSAERERHFDLPGEQWLRAATWWLLKARSSFEFVVYNKLPSSDRLCQDCHGYLAKALWIVEEALSPSNESRGHIDFSGSGGAPIEEFGVIKDGLRKLAIAMKRQDLWTPTESIALVPQDFDYSIMVEYPSFEADIWETLSRGNRGPLTLPGNHQRLSRRVLPISDLLPLSDTSKTFVYSTMFVDVILFEGSKEVPSFKFPCLLSVRRPKTQKEPEILIASQNSLLTLLVQLNSDVGWHMQPNALEIKVGMGITVRIQFSSWDFYGLRCVFNRASHINPSMEARSGEELIFEATAKSAQYAAANPESQRFPTQPVRDCVVHVLENVTTEMTPSGTCNKQRGFRLAVMTSPATRDLSCIAHNIGFGHPTKYVLLGKEHEDPGLLLSFGAAGQESLITLHFDYAQERLDLLRCITGQLPNHEVALADVPLKSLSIADGASALVSADESPISALGPQRVSVYPNSITIEGTHGVLTDRLQVRSTTLKLRLPHRQPAHSLDLRLPPHTLLVYRDEQSDLTMGIAQAAVPRAAQDALADALRRAAKPAAVRAYQFDALHDLHAFQSALTNLAVAFDGHAAAFSIARRRMLVPVYKQWKASVVRLQILRRAKGKLVQLAVFFEGFRHASAMTFVLKPTDVFEALVSRQGQFGVRLVDAKFPLPKKPTNAGGEEGFVDFCDLEYPGEHDDITIFFDDEQERDRFTRALPAAVKKMHS